MPIYIMPALLIRMSTGPWARMRAKPSATEVSLVTSIPAMAMRGEWASSSAFLAALRPSASRIVPQTRSPRSAKARTAAAPKPLLAPVITTVLPICAMGRSPCLPVVLPTGTNNGDTPSRHKIPTGNKMSDDDPKPARGRPRTMNAETVRDVAMTAYWQSDPADVSVNAICRMAGVSKPSLYRAFGSEDGLARAALDSYAERVLSDVFAILQSGAGLRKTLEALIDFASADPRMETGCLFYKMRAGKHRLGPQTRARVEEIDTAAH